MSGSAFRERQVPPDEVRRVTKRAAELALIEAKDNGASLSEAELVERLAALGIPSDVARRAIEAPAANTVASADGVLRVVREVELDGMLPPERHEEIADAIALVMKMPGRVSVVGNKVSWVPGGMLTEPAVTVHARNGRTRISYVETLANRGQATVGFVVLAGLAGLISGTFATGSLVAIAKAMGITAREGATAVFAMGIVIGAAAFVGALLGLRRQLDRRLEVRSMFADEVLAQLSSATRAAIATEPSARLRVAAGSDASEDELDAEEQQARRVVR